jgi:hypothetical protein
LVGCSCCSAGHDTVEGFRGSERAKVRDELASGKFE